MGGAGDARFTRLIAALAREVAARSAPPTDQDPRGAAAWRTGGMDVAA